MSDTTVIEAGTQEEPKPFTDVEARARRMGWRPKEEFRGPPDRWSSAEDFIARGENELPILRERNRNLDRQLEETGRTVTELKTRMEQTGEVLSSMREMGLKAEERAYKKARAEIEEEMRTRAAAADVVGVTETQRKLEELDKERETAKVAPAPVVAKVTDAPAAKPRDPVAEQWITDNPWFTSDAEMNSTAQGIHTGMLQSRKDLSLADNLAETKRRIMKLYPEKFANANRDEAIAVAQPSGNAPAPTNRNKKKTYADLPADAKAACDKYVKQINSTKPKVPYTPEEYVSMYEASGGFAE